VKRKSIPESVRKSVFERDNWICQSCGVKVHNEKLIKPKIKRIYDKGKPFFTKEYYEWVNALNKERELINPHNFSKACIDHINPLSWWGWEGLDNYQTLCFECNSIKGGKNLPLGTNIKTYRLSL
jgi:5-methylcytosine-specific restriction endonuclease McrA